MKKLITALWLIGSVSIMSSANAGFGEKEWHFAPSEVEIIDATAPGQAPGFVCKTFSPKEVSFTIAYEEPEGMPFKLSVIADDPAKVTHDKVNHIYTVTKAKTLELDFYHPGKYKVTNTTGVAIVGTDCDAGLN